MIEIAAAVRAALHMPAAAQPRAACLSCWVPYTGLYKQQNWIASSTVF